MITSLALAAALAASQSQVHVVEGMHDLLQGDLDNTALTPDGVIKVGPAMKVLADAMTGPVLAVTKAGDGSLYAATASPGRVWKIGAAGAKPETVLESDKPLVTALLPVGKNKLVAITAPDGGAEVIDLATKKHESIPCKDAKMLLGATVVDDVIYAVGGGEEGVLVKLAPGALAWEVAAKTKEAQLRSVAAAKVNGALKIVVGGGDDGVIYEVNAGKVRALLDAVPTEVTALALDKDGTVFASVVDGEGKLSKGALAKAKEDTSSSDPDKKPQKARKVKSAEIWRIDAKGRARVLWQSKDHGAYALALHDGKLLAGTGPEGRIYEIDPSGGRAAGIWLRLKDHDEVTSLFVDNAGGVDFGTAHAAAVVRADKQQATAGVYISPPLDAEALARYGSVTSRGRGAIKLSVRTGNTKEPDDTWSTWTSPATAAPLGQYAQVKAELTGGASLEGVTLSYLVDNRPPEIDRVEVLAPGWKVVATQRDQSETRSVTFNEKPFQKYLDRRGGQNPTLEERGFGKQSFDQGYRTVYAYVEDPDKDALRYRWYLGKVDGNDGQVSKWNMVKEWSDEPFVSFESSRLSDGEYRVKVMVDDQPTNGPARKLGNEDLSPAFVVSHAPPKLSGALATREKDRIHVKLDVAAALPLTVVRCSAGGEEWVPLDPKDGIIDGAAESFDATLDGNGKFNAVSCEVYDEALNFNRIDIPVGG